VARERTTDEAGIRAQVDALVHAIRGRDLEGVMAVFAPNVVSFDIGPPLRHGGGDEFRPHWQAMFAAWKGGIDFEAHELDIAVGGDVAFSHSLNRTAGTAADGHRAERWLRWTACWRRFDRRWLIVHEHVSVPADLRSGTALFDLRP